MVRVNKVISMIVSACFLLNAVASDLAFSQTLNHGPNTDKLATPSGLSDIVGIQPKDEGRIKLALENLLMQLFRNRQIIDISAFKTLGKRYFKENTIFQPADIQFFCHEVKRTNAGPCVMVRLKDKYGLRTYYATFPLQKDKDGGVPINIYTKEQYKSAAEFKNGTPEINPEDTIAVNRYVEKNERVIDKFIRERIVAGDFAEMKGRAEKLDLDQRFPSRIKSKLYFENFLPLLQDDLEKFLGIFNISLSTAFDGKNIVFIKVPQGVDYPVIYENGQPITVKSHTSENAVYFFLDKIKFERLERDSILLDGTHSDICFGQILAIISISLDTIVHEIGVAYGLPYEITPEGEIVNDLDKAYAQDYLELGDKLLTQFPRLRNLTKANLDKNLLTRDYAAGASSSNNGAEMCILRNQWKGQDIQVPLEVARKVFQEIVRLKSEDPNKWHALLTFTEFLYEKDLMSYTLHEETRFWRSSSLKKALDVLSGSIFINNNRTAPEYVCAIIRNSFESKPVTDELFSGTFNSPNSAYLMDPLKGGSEKDYQNSMLLRDPVTSPFDIFAQGFSLNIGAYTDQTNLPHLKEIGIGASLVGHSETRYREVKVFDKESGKITGSYTQQGDTDEVINQKLKSASQEGLETILCVGEPREVRDAKAHVAFVLDQIQKDLKGLSEEEILKAVRAIAYEPIWAIGTGLTASDQDAQDMCKVIRDYLRQTYSEEFAKKMRIMYGGSVTPESAEGLFSQPDIDGFLIGGASLRIESFASISQTVNKSGPKEGRTPIVAANWKATAQKQRDSLEEFNAKLSSLDLKQVNVVMALPSVLLAQAKEMVKPQNSSAVKAAPDVAVDAIIKEIAAMDSLAKIAGVEVAPPSERYNLLVTSEFFASGELEKHRLMYGDRFDLDKISGTSHKQLVNNILGKAGNRGAKTIALIPNDLPDEELKRLTDAGIRFMGVNTADLVKAQHAPDADPAYRKKFQVDTYAMMLLLRHIDKNTSADSSIYSLLRFYLKSHFTLPEGVTVDDYIKAIIVNDDVRYLIRGCLAYRPIEQYDLPDYNKVAASLISA